MAEVLLPGEQLGATEDPVANPVRGVGPIDLKALKKRQQARSHGTQGPCTLSTSRPSRPFSSYKVSVPCHPSLSSLVVIPHPSLTSLVAILIVIPHRLLVVIPRRLNP